MINAVVIHLKDGRTDATEYGVGVGGWPGWDRWVVKRAVGYFNTDRVDEMRGKERR